MMLTCIFSAVPFAAAGLAGPTLVVALAVAPQPAATGARGPTAIEQALIERSCSEGRSAGTQRYDAYGECLDTQLVALRASFGRDLSRLSAPDRKKLDSICSHLASVGREAYLDCLHTGLASLSAPRRHASLPVPVATSVAVVPVNAPLDTGLSNAVPANLLTSLPTVAGSALLLTLGAGALVLFAVRSRRARQLCRGCGVRVAGAGDRCASCRHDAAEALRLASAERADRHRAHAEDQRRQREQAEEEVQQKAHAEEETRLRGLQEVRRRDEARQREDEALRREEDARRRHDESGPAPAAVGDEDASPLDPYVVLGLEKGASDEQIRAAFAEARSKYDPEQVAHLGIDAQEHFAAKSRAAERAFQMLG